MSLSVLDRENNLQKKTKKQKKDLEIRKRAIEKEKNKC